MKMTVNLQGLKRNAWRKNLTGFFTINGKPLSDSQVRKLVNWGIEHGCRTNEDIPSEKIMEIISEKQIDKETNDKQLKLF